MKILFVCSGNTCRSPMANAFFRQGVRDRCLNGEKGELNSGSAGLWAYEGQPASPQAVAVMQAQGIDISRHRSVLLQPELVQEADLILTMTISQRDYLAEQFPSAARQIFTLSEYAGDEAGEVLDPYGKGLGVYRRSLEQIKFLVDRLLHKIIESV